MNNYIRKIFTVSLALTMTFISFVNVSAFEKKNDVTVIEVGNTRIVTENTLNESVVVVFENEEKTKGTIRLLIISC